MNKNENTANNPLITIGIPVYKSEAYIRQTLDSLLAQTYPSIEFLFVDDCGGDSSLSVIQEIKESHPRGSDIHLITHLKNKGVSLEKIILKKNYFVILAIN